MLFAAIKSDSRIIEAIKMGFYKLSSNNYSSGAGLKEITWIELMSYKHGAIPEQFNLSMRLIIRKEDSLT